MQKPAKIKEVSWVTMIETYGIIPVLMALDDLEQDEFYETCGEIQKALKEIGEVIEEELPTKYSREVEDSLPTVFLTAKDRHAAFIMFKDRILHYLGYR